ncbi:tRNA (adenosine(37)-N6)-threonylcarbamoyltransferase complex ATPase subunit type 1 TsaE [Desulfosporosinus shakirovi]|uniref:tRNA (adenosine(37)-N6)-threonylcarbamoyltransferase complex ATPase subunit type 1 TsaE n=1 Tax=Desulfosporosinus shakirovi TaxID=2885154 RepID=UPI001E3A7D7F|nr:tRNA (adenosine(37)-N6)-threonylcarbamoyltransferase complex ATPase subunit type 1 TsaE [Desulfosporosinus sp. SRJS8]MCB8816975.1 tRNA (adenosine(37)-N6)-threonylcarbamoyltransferase complex ATPase subunit type 1 TsaE [Desulfosporosinus sp. SRJS8]
MDYRVTSLTFERTQELGKQLSECLLGGDVVGLTGDLGAGKTAFAQGIGKGLGVVGPMTSPTFTLIHEYESLIKGTKIRLIHMDLYRLRHPEEAEVIGIEDAFVDDAICLIEWPEIAEDYLPDDCLNVEIRGSGEMPREIIFHAKDSSWEQRLEFLFK